MVKEMLWLTMAINSSGRGSLGTPRLQKGFYGAERPTGELVGWAPEQPH